MKFKISLLAALLVAAFPLSAKAQDTNSYESLKVSCNSGAECSDFGVNFQEEGDEVAQTRRTRTRRTRRGSSDKKIYAGVTLGAFFSGELDEIEVIEDNEAQNIDLGTAFGGSIYGGYKFSDLIGGDAELVVLGGGADPVDDGGYTAVGFFANPRITYAFNKDNERSPYVFASPGIGFVTLSLNDDVEDELNNDDLSGTGFAIQAKLGAGYPVTDLIDVIGQVRYVNSFNNFEVIEGGGSEDQGFDSFGIELGANFKF